MNADNQSTGDNGSSERDWKAGGIEMRYDRASYSRKGKRVQAQWSSATLRLQVNCGRWSA